MRDRLLKKILSLTLTLVFAFQQTGFAQTIAELNIPRHFNSLSHPDKFRPLHLRYFSYDTFTDNFEILLDKGDVKLKDTQIKAESRELLKYFLIGVSLPNESFWVNLRPDKDDQIIDTALARTDIGKILLEADLQLKKDTARFTSPETAEGRAYWNKLYQKANELFGSENITIPTLTRPWIVPGEIIIRQTADSAYIYKAGLKVMLEQDHLKNSSLYNFKDERMKQLNEYSSELIRKDILPKLTKEINNAVRYAPLRQVFYSLVLSRWFKGQFKGKDGLYSSRINQGGLNGLTSQGPWQALTYFKAYQKSFKEGEYKMQERVSTPSGQVIRRYFSGGVDFSKGLDVATPDKQSGFGAFVGQISNFAGIASGRTNMVSLEGAARANSPLPELRTRSSSPIQIRTDFSVPEGQKEGFFTNDYHSYTIGGLFAAPQEQIPGAVVNAVKKKLKQDMADGRILSAEVHDFSGAEIDIHVTHRYGEGNAAVQRLVIEAIKAGCVKAQDLGLLKKGVDVKSMSLADLAKALRLKYQPHSITERAAEAVVVAKIIGAGIGSANIKLYHEFFITGSTPLQKLGFLPKPGEKDKPPVRGFRAVVRRTEDVLKGNFNGDVWEFEKSAAATVKGKEYPSVDQSLELLVLASQPNDFVITAIYAVEGSLLPSTEPVVSVVYQSVYGEEGNLRTLNPTFLCRSQSGADAVGGIASMFYDVNFVPGGPNGERYVATRPATLSEARKAPKEGMAHVVVYGWQSKLNGVIPSEKDGVIDHVAINYPALQYERRLADFLAGVMKAHEYDQPYVAPFAAQAKAESLRKQQSHLFVRAPKDADIDPYMEEVEARVSRGEYLSVTDDKADMGGKFGHNFTPEYMLAIDLATIMEAQERGVLTDGNIIGFVEQMRLKRGTTNSIGDDSHMLMLGDKSPNSRESHQLSFIAFTRGYLASMVGNSLAFDPTKGFTHPEKTYGRAQDYQGKEAKAAMKNPYFYSHFSERFFEILREVMSLDYMQTVDNLYSGWKHWEKTKQSGELAKGFSGNVSNQGIGTARYLVDIAGGERTFGGLFGDKMGPAGFNRVIREGVYASLAAGEFPNGLIFEIWDTKAFDEHGNIPLNELPGLSDVEEYIPELKEKAKQDFVIGCYDLGGSLKTSSTQEDKEKLVALLKESGYVPSKRIFLDALQDKETIYTYLADSDRFLVKQVWEKQIPDWDINNPRASLRKPGSGTTVTKLGLLAGGEYVGKDDPAKLGSMKLMKYVFEFLMVESLLLQGDMNGSHWLAAIPTAFKNAVANKESHPILVGLVYTLSEDGTKLASVEDVFAKKEYNSIRRRMFEFNYKFKQAQLGGQFEPYGTNWRTVEAAYPLAKLLRALQDPDSPFLVRNKPVAGRESRPIGIVQEAPELFQYATAASSPVADRPVSSSPINDAKPVTTAPDGLGGIDFKAMNIITRPMGSFSGLKFNLPVLSNVERINLNEQFDQIQRMIKSDKVPLGSRFTEYLAASYQKKEIAERRSDIIASLIELCWLEESLGNETSPEVKEAMVLAEGN